MLPVLAAVSERTSLSWESLVAQVLTLLIYGVLGPAVYVNILFLGIELSLPRGTRMRRVLRARLPPRPTAFSIADNDPYFHFLCGVGGLLALAAWSLVVTTWLSGYLHWTSAPQLAAPRASVPGTLTFALAAGLGVLGGYSWASGMRLARDGRACLIVVAASMSLSGIALFFFLVEPAARDTLLVLALSTFVGELTVAARHPSLWGEGLYGELLRAPAESAPVEDAAEEELGAPSEAERTADSAVPPQPHAGRTQDHRGVVIAAGHPEAQAPMPPRPPAGLREERKP
jgi:hypothetical protein